MVQYKVNKNYLQVPSARFRSLKNDPPDLSRGEKQKIKQITQKALI